MAPKVDLTLLDDDLEPGHVEISPGGLAGLPHLSWRAPPPTGTAAPLVDLTASPVAVGSDATADLQENQRRGLLNVATGDLKLCCMDRGCLPPGAVEKRELVDALMASGVTPADVARHAPAAAAAAAPAMSAAPGSAGAAAAVPLHAGPAAAAGAGAAVPPWIAAMSNARHRSRASPPGGGLSTHGHAGLGVPSAAAGRPQSANSHPISAPWTADGFTSHEEPNAESSASPSSDDDADIEPQAAGGAAAASGDGKPPRHARANVPWTEGELQFCVTVARQGEKEGLLVGSINRALASELQRGHEGVASKVKGSKHGPAPAALCATGEWNHARAAVVLERARKVDTERNAVPRRSRSHSSSRGGGGSSSHGGGGSRSRSRSRSGSRESAAVSGGGAASSAARIGRSAEPRRASSGRPSRPPLPAHRLHQQHQPTPPLPPRPRPYSGRAGGSSTRPPSFVEEQRDVCYDHYSAGRINKKTLMAADPNCKMSTRLDIENNEEEANAVAYVLKATKCWACGKQPAFCQSFINEHVGSGAEPSVRVKCLACGTYCSDTTYLKALQALRR